MPDLRRARKPRSQRSVWPLASDLTLPPSSHPELVACSNGMAGGDINLEHLLALDGAAGFVGEGGDDPPRPRSITSPVDG